jgi:hypothetical protein
LTNEAQYARNIHTLELTGVDNINLEMVRNVAVLRMFHCNLVLNENSEGYYLEARSVEFVLLKEAISFEKIRFSQVSTVILIGRQVENMCFLGDYPSLKSLQIVDCALMTENDSVNIQSVQNLFISSNVISAFVKTSLLKDVRLAYVNTAELLEQLEQLINTSPTAEKLTLCHSTISYLPPRSNLTSLYLYFRSLTVVDTSRFPRLIELKLEHCSSLRKVT